MDRPAPVTLLLGSAAALVMVGVTGWVSLPASVGSALPANSLYAMWLAAGGLAIGIWIVRARPVTTDPVIAAAATLAALAPLAMVPLVGSTDATIVRLGLTVAAIGALPLGLVLADRAPSGSSATRARAVGIMGVGAALVIGVVGETFPDLRTAGYVAPADLSIRWMLLGLATVVPGAVAAVSALRASGAATPVQRILAGLGLATAGIVPCVTGIALVTQAWHIFALPIVAAGLMAAVLGRVAIGPLARVAGSAASERDRVVAAAEAERGRLAATLHDGPLGDIALLVQRLDQAGDADNAAIARSIANDLRDIGNDLKVPVLEDLGAGPALEWLAERIGRRAGARVQVEIEATVRPPAVVELAIYRIAHEAVVNAVKHGRPPVSVRYVATPDRVSLTVADMGPGLDRAAAGRARKEGRMGLLTMAQRAEAIGATLVVGTAGTTGTRVGLEWAPAPG